MKRVGLVLLPVVLLVSGCSAFRAKPEPPTVSVFALPLRNASPETDITRLDGRAQAAIVNNLSEMVERDPVSFLETIASPVFRGETSQSQQDLSKLKLRLVFSVQSSKPPAPGPPWIQITLTPAGGKFLNWTRLVSGDEEIDFEQVRFQSRPPAPRSFLRRAPRPTTTSVSIDEDRLIIVREGKVLGSFSVDVEVDLERGTEIFIGRLASRPSRSGSSASNVWIQKVYLPKTWNLQSRLVVKWQGGESPEHLTSLISSDQIDLSLWVAKAKDGRHLPPRQDGHDLYFASQQEATAFLERWERAAGGYILEPVSAASFSPEKESAK